jgi:RNA polymerase sigma factor (sigma-70 family)
MPAPAPALRLEEPTFCESLANYVAAMSPQFGIRRADVKDIAQDVLLNVVASFKTYQPEKGEFDKWARGVALNVIRKHARGARRDAAMFCEYHPNAEHYATLEHSPEYCARKTEARRAISNAAEPLSTLKAQILVLHVVDGMTHKDIANELQISAAKSEKDCQRTLHRLAECVPRELLSVMPPSLSRCDEPVSYNEKDSRWSERSHYIGQVSATIMAVFLMSWQMSPSTTYESVTSEARVLGPTKNVAMYHPDEHVDVRDELKVLRDAPSGKPEPAQTTSVRDVSTPAKLVDKPANVWQSAPLPPFKPTEDHSAHLPLGQ